MKKSGAHLSQLEATVRNSINDLYERILADEVFRSLRDCQESRDYIVLRIEEMVRDTVGTDRREALERLVEENTERKQEIERVTGSLEIAHQQAQQWRSTAEAMRLENDRLKFEVVGCGQHAQQQVKRLKEQIQQTRDALTEARLSKEKAEAQVQVLSHSLKSREADIEELTKRLSRPENETKVEEGSRFPQVREKECPATAIPTADQRLQKSMVLVSTIEVNRLPAQGTSARSMKDLRSQHDHSELILEVGPASHESNERLLRQELMDYAKEVERLKKQLKDEQERAAASIALFKTEFEKLKGEVKDYRRLKETDKLVVDENEKLQGEHFKHQLERDGLIKQQHLLEKQLSEAKQLFKGEAERVQEMDSQIIALNKTIRTLEAELGEWKQRLQRSEDVRTEQLDEMKEQHREMLRKLQLKQQSAHIMEVEYGKAKNGANRELQSLVEANERLQAELLKQKEQSAKKIAEIDRLNRDLKAMYERKIELMTSNSKEQQQKSQKHRSQARVLKDESREYKSRTDRLEQEVKILQDKLIQLTKANSLLEKEARTARNECRVLEKSGKQQQIRLELLTETLKAKTDKLRLLRPRIKELQSKLFALNASNQDTKFQLIQTITRTKLHNEQLMKELAEQLQSKIVTIAKGAGQATRLLQEQLNSTRIELNSVKLDQRQYEKQQAEHRQLIQQLEERLASKQIRDAEQLQGLERQVADLQRLCRKLQETNSDNLREIEYLQKARHEQRLERQFRSPHHSENDVTVVPTVVMAPMREKSAYANPQHRTRLNMTSKQDLGSMAHSNTVREDASVHELQRHYDKLIRTLEDENIKLRSETTRAEVMFERQLAKLNDMYKSRDKLIPYSVQELPTYETKPREKKASTKSRHELAYRTHSSTDKHLMVQDRRQHGNALTLDIKRDIEQQKRRLEETRHQLNGCEYMS